MTGDTKKAGEATRREALLGLGGAIGALVYRFVTPGWARGPGDVGGPGT